MGTSLQNFKTTGTVSPFLDIPYFNMHQGYKADLMFTTGNLSDFPSAQSVQKFSQMHRRIHVQIDRLHAVLQKHSLCQHYMTVQVKICTKPKCCNF